ncbi:Hypothetical protein NTJ_09678 [Nesidiocoris tenuis]|uniref:Uncharacterized protein n=1 Tax=Nesidiocoris tenuis TaxID=355587 RepID=A0ABN7AXF4_9HEMI|nr:Hypothetical protein NTJ_09678 [Nesidiocoris tenuis]
MKPRATATPSLDVSRQPKHAEQHSPNGRLQKVQVSSFVAIPSRRRSLLKDETRKVIRKRGRGPERRRAQVGRQELDEMEWLLEGIQRGMIDSVGRLSDTLRILRHRSHTAHEHMVLAWLTNGNNTEGLLQHGSTASDGHMLQDPLQDLGTKEEIF